MSMPSGGRDRSSHHGDDPVRFTIFQSGINVRIAISGYGIYFMVIALPVLAAHCSMGKTFWKRNGFPIFCGSQFSGTLRSSRLCGLSFLLRGASTARRFGAMPKRIAPYYRPQQASQ
jgi:hypothetical protein